MLRYLTYFKLFRFCFSDFLCYSKQQESRERECADECVNLGKRQVALNLFISLQ